MRFLDFEYVIKDNIYPIFRVPIKTIFVLFYYTLIHRLFTFVLKKNVFMLKLMWWLVDTMVYYYYSQQLRVPALKLVSRRRPVDRAVNFCCQTVTTGAIVCAKNVSNARGKWRRRARVPRPFCHFFTVRNVRVCTVIAAISRFNFDFVFVRHTEKTKK